ncbi:MAG: hypothetical protein MUP16_08275, partial [Sedimentisphaerales bacterium]|nr:hypothetical protein [Sedimentisphaerales bacterium]
MKNQKSECSVENNVSCPAPASAFAETSRNDNESFLQSKIKMQKSKFFILEFSHLILLLTPIQRWQ